MTPLIAITSDRTGTSDFPARSSALRRAHPRNHPERRTFAVVAICGQQGFRARAAGLVVPFDETETWARNQETRLLATHSQSAAVTSGGVTPTGHSPGWLIAGARCVLARHRPFYSARPLKASGVLIPSLRIQPRKQTRSGFTQSLKSFSALLIHASKETHEAFRWNEKVFPNLTKVLAKVT